MFKHNTHRMTFATAIIVTAMYLAGCSRDGLFHIGLAAAQSWNSQTESFRNRDAPPKIKKDMAKKDLLILNQALDSKAIGRTLHWSNHKSGMLYRVKPIVDFHNTNNSPCRRYTLRIITQGRKRIFREEACRNKQGQWLSVMAKSDDRDLQIALDERWNQKRKWHNKESDIRYKLIPADIYRNASNVKCRRFQLTSWENGQTFQSSLSACKGSNNLWIVGYR